MRRVLRSHHLQWLLPTVIVLADLCLAGSALAQADHKSVLVLYSMRRDSEFATVGEVELPRALDVGLDRNLD